MLVFSLPEVDLVYVAGVLQIPWFSLHLLYAENSAEKYDL